MVELLWHGTNDAALESARRDGALRPGYWGTERVASSYAGLDIPPDADFWDPMVVSVPLTALDERFLQPDWNSVDDIDDDDRITAWLAGAQDWRASLDMVGAVYYAAPVPFELLGGDALLLSDAGLKPDLAQLKARLMPG